MHERDYVNCSITCCGPRREDAHWPCLLGKPHSAIGPFEGKICTLVPFLTYLRYLSINSARSSGADVVAVIS
jgi:hypothetical protein